MIKKILFILSLISGLEVIIVTFISVYVFIFINNHDIQKTFGYIIIASLIIFGNIITEYFYVNDDDF